MDKTSELYKSYAALAQKLSSIEGVTFGSGKRGFGSDALHYNGKIFAMVTSKGGFAVKLDRQKVKDMVSAGQGEFLEMGARKMKEWFVAGHNCKLSWQELAHLSIKCMSVQA